MWLFWCVRITPEVLVNRKDNLHHGLSPNNILWNMIHNNKCKFDDYLDDKYIHEVLNGLCKERLVMVTIAFVI